MDFLRYRVKQEIAVYKLITCYYFELAKNYAFAGEKHDFWELLYVDKGELLVETDSMGEVHLKQGDLLFHEPNDFHRTRCNGSVPTNIFVVTFECASAPIAFFRQHKRFRPRAREKEILAWMMSEGGQAFGPDPAGRPLYRLVRKQAAPFGSEQLFVMYLQTLLILLIRGEASGREDKKLPLVVKHESGPVEQIIAYMESNPGQDLTLRHLCAVFAIGKTQLSIMFKKKTGCGVMEYWSHLKIEKAKEYIREDMFNLTEIAELLGYNSVHYFSKHFKKMTGMTPSEYAKTLKAQLFKRTEK